jgi:glycosyltransferase involved in cell wall biosynthesis
MRILSVTQSYYPFLDMGGPTVKVRAIARGMVAAGHQSTVLTADMGLDSGAQKLIQAVPSRWGFEARDGGVEAIYLRTLARHRALTWNPGAADFCRERLPSCDIVHIYGLYDLLGPTVARACRHLGRPYIVEPMGMFLPIVRNIPMKRIYHALWGGRMLRDASRVIATAEQEHQEFLAGGIPDHKIVVRRNGIEAPSHLPPKGEFRNQWDIQPDVKVVLFLGRMVSKKSPDLMLEAFAGWRRQSPGNQRAILVMAGPDERDGFRERLESFAGELGLHHSVLFTGPLYEGAKWAAYQDADLFVLPSQNENFGNTAAEAIACGTPVLVTDQCGIAPMVDGRAGVVVRHDLASIEAGLQRVLNNPKVSAQLRCECSNVMRSLGWAEPLAQMESLYLQLIGEKHAG